MTIIAQQIDSVFSSYPVVATTNYVYNENASTEDSAGWYNSLYDDVLVAIRCGTLNATDLQYRIEGRGDTNYTSAIDLYSDTITTAQTIDEAINIVERVSEIRIGVKKTNNDNAASAYFSAGIIFTNSR